MTENFYTRNLPEPPVKNYSMQEVIYHLEVLTLNKRSAIPQIKKPAIKPAQLIHSDNL